MSPSRAGEVHQREKHMHVQDGFRHSPSRENDYDYFAQEGKMFPIINEDSYSEMSISWRKRQDRKDLSIYFTERLKVLTA